MAGALCWKGVRTLNRRQSIGGLTAAACCASVAFAKSFSMKGLPATLKVKLSMMQLQPERQGEK